MATLAAGVGGSAAEPVGRLDQQHVETFARGGVRTGDATAARPRDEHVVFFAPLHHCCPYIHRNHLNKAALTNVRCQQLRVA
jgi:hypothetical protein